MADVKAKPLYREMNMDEQARLAKVFVDSLDRVIKCCPNCEHFKVGSEQCGLNNQRPPARIIAFGCECFEEEEYIPF